MPVIDITKLVATDYINPEREITGPDAIVDGPYAGMSDQELIAFWRSIQTSAATSWTCAMILSKVVRMLKYRKIDPSKL